MPWKQAPTFQIYQFLWKKEKRKNTKLNKQFLNEISFCDNTKFLLNLKNIIFLNNEGTDNQGADFHAF